MIFNRQNKIDKLVVFSLVAIFGGYLLSFFPDLSLLKITWIHHYAFGLRSLVNQIWWGILLSIFITGFLSKVPREMIVALMGTKKGFRGILRATFAGLFLDVCNHGILVIGMKLYERGATIGQTMAFLIASPWNSLTLTFILITLIGTPWTLAFIVFSAVIGLSTGVLMDRLVARGILPDNPNKVELRPDYNLLREAQNEFKNSQWNLQTFIETIRLGFKESRSVMRWVLIGIVITGVLRASLDTEQMQTYFGPTLMGVLITLFFAIIIEVCSEGSTPIAADILTIAKAPGNAFTFLMAGVCSDYTEILAIRETTKSRKIALFMPLVSIPQILFIAWIMNHYG